MVLWPEKYNILHIKARQTLILVRVLNYVEQTLYKCKSKANRQQLARLYLQLGDVQIEAWRQGKSKKQPLSNWHS